MKRCSISFIFREVLSQNNSEILLHSFRRAGEEVEQQELSSLLMEYKW